MSWTTGRIRPVEPSVDEDDKRRVEEAVKQNLLDAVCLRIIELHEDKIEREGYWERQFIVAWVNYKESGTHKVCINSEGKEMCVDGHYWPKDTEGDKACEDAARRAR